MVHCAAGISRASTSCMAQLGHKFRIPCKIAKKNGLHFIGVKKTTYPLIRPFMWLWLELTPFHLIGVTAPVIHSKFGLQLITSSN